MLRNPGSQATDSLERRLLKAVAVWKANDACSEDGRPRSGQAMLRRDFVKWLLALGAGLRGGTLLGGLLPGGRKILAGRLPGRAFPVTVQWSRLPDGTEAAKPFAALSKSEIHAVIDEIIGHGFTGLEYPLAGPAGQTSEALKYAQRRGMYVTYDRTFMKGGVENIPRNAPPPVSVFSPEYAVQVRRNVVAAFEQVKGIARPYNMFGYHDEPFHEGPESFDYSEPVRREFKNRYGYDLPPDVDSAMRDPKVWLDVISFRSDEFTAGWRQAYRIIKEINPGIQVALTHDSHSTFGAGVRSNSKLAVDDVFHWGADFADTFVFDIYPYMMFDFRYGECGTLRKPRMSQMHYAFAQMRNLTYTYGKELEQITEGKKPFWMVLQVCWSGVAKPGKTLRFPTFPQERYMAFQSIIDGARGLVFFDGTVKACLNARDSELGWNWTFYQNVLKLVLNQLNPSGPVFPALVAPDSKLDVKLSGASDIEYRAREADGYLYILAAKRQGATVHVRFSGLPSDVGSGDVLFEEPRKVTVSDGEFTDWFAPHDVHIYRFKEAGRSSEQ